MENILKSTKGNNANTLLATGTKPIHLLCRQSTTKCGYTLYNASGILIENTTTDKSKVTCKNCLRAK